MPLLFTSSNVVLWGEQVQGFFSWQWGFGWRNGLLTARLTSKSIRPYYNIQYLSLSSRCWEINPQEKKWSQLWKLSTKGREDCWLCPWERMYCIMHCMPINVLGSLFFQLQFMQQIQAFLFFHKSPLNETDIRILFRCSLNICTI